MTVAAARAWCEREGLAAPDHVRRESHGTLAGFREVAGQLRRALEFDRHGTLMSVLAWVPEGRLASARLRLPDRGWLTIEPRTVTDPRWGASDRLASPSGALTHCEAVAWDDVDRIPVLAEPARVPPGGGSAVLNLLARLAADRARPALRYHGPYPTESLFLTLLESFRPEPPATADPLARFGSGGLAWVPDPHERLFDPSGLVVQLRGRVDKVTAGACVYYRADWHGIARHAPRRVRDVDDRVVCSLWALGEPLEDHLLLSASGDVLEDRRSAPASGPARPFPPVVTAGVLAVVVARSAPQLAGALGAAAIPVRFEWGPVKGDLVRVDRDTVRIADRLWTAARAQAAARSDRAGRLAVATATLAEVGHLVADDLRARAQARLAAAPLDAQAAALADLPPPAGARAIAAAVEALAAQLTA